MPDWAKPSAQELEELKKPQPTREPRTAKRSEVTQIVSATVEPAPPQTVDELRAAMENIVANKEPAAENPTKKERRQARAERRAAQESDEPEVFSDDQWREKARGIVLRQLTASDKTSKQLKDKLLEKECPEDIADEVLERYAELNLVDDERFAKSWVAARARSRGLARGAIRRELRTKGIDDEVAAEALEQIDDEAEEQRARELARTKLRPASMGLDRDKALRRLVGMLGRKGYHGSMAFKVAREEWEERYGEK
ncbi:regulatory protein RecX [Arthrobacter sp. MYb213]|uniref:regulatory protein RecX n=1 Tax=Arthrobacter sp. MYb213 TaxID=1848595 RepID=UPI0025701C06|nr:regulatory protein RecX [Arthrobacter sp. MYb213]